MNEHQEVNYVRGHTKPLILTLRRLQNPDICIEYLQMKGKAPSPVEEFAWDTETIGKAYAYFVGSIPSYLSPGRIREHLLPFHAKEEFEHRFQHATRDFFYQMLEEVEKQRMPKKNAASYVIERYDMPHVPGNFKDGSVEELTLSLWREVSPAQLGELILQGAVEYLNFTIKENMRNCHIAREYREIQRALSSFKKL